GGPRVRVDRRGPELRDREAAWLAHQGVNRVAAQADDHEQNAASIMIQGNIEGFALSSGSRSSSRSSRRRRRRGGSSSSRLSGSGALGAIGRATGGGGFGETGAGF